MRFDPISEIMTARRGGRGATWDVAGHHTRYRYGTSPAVTDV